MNWTLLQQQVGEAVGTLVGLAILAAMAVIVPAAKAWLTAKFGETTAAQIEKGLALAVKVTETTTGLETGPEKLAFATVLAQAYFDAHGLKLDAGSITQRIEAALLSQKMEGLRGVVVPIVVASLPAAPPEGPGLTGGVQDARLAQVRDSFGVPTPNTGV